MENIKVISSEVVDRIVTVDDLIRIYEIDLDKWQIVKKVVNTWESTAKDAEGNIKVSPNFQVKLWLESRTYEEDLKKIRQEFIDSLKDISPSAPFLHNKTLYSKNNNEDKHLLEINIFDLHLGKISWDSEVGHTYDIKTACMLFENAINHFLNTSKTYNIDRIVLPVGNDFFNSDRSHPYNSTTKGTPQEEDARWQNTFKTGRELLVRNITKLSERAPVDVIMIPGNHDLERNFYLGDSLEGWFYNNPNVEVNNNPSSRKYYSYGNVLIGYTHGNQEKVASLPLIMAQEVPNLWASSKYREFHLGHIHQKKSTVYKPLEEHSGIIVRSMSSLSGTDTWHHSKGYVQNLRTAEAIIWNKEHGQSANLFYNSKV